MFFLEVVWCVVPFRCNLSGRLIAEASLHAVVQGEPSDEAGIAMRARSPSLEGRSNLGQGLLFGLFTGGFKVSSDSV